MNHQQNKWVPRGWPLGGVWGRAPEEKHVHTRITEPIIIFLSGLAVLMLGCHVQDVPECLTNAERCDMQAEMGSAVYYVCSEHNTWQPVMGCVSCDGNRCADIPDFIECSDNDDAMCVESGAVALSLTCNDHLWIPSVCAQGCKEGHCTGKDKPCVNGEKSCYSLGDFGASVQSVCENERWTSWFCPEGAGCDGDVCENITQQTKSCDSGFADCNDNTEDGCETELSSKNLVTCKECQTGYGNCDNDLSNGCEVELSSKNLSTCTECKTGYGNCDNDLTNGCEVELSSKDLATCTECQTGYGDCDNDLTNGCEFDLVSAGLASCGGCAENQCYVGETCKDAKTTTEACGSACLNCTQQDHVETAKCDNGTCVPLTCESDYEVCQNQCMDLNGDNDNCGGCGNKCDTDSGERCFQGVCEKTRIYCTPGSADLKSFNLGTEENPEIVQAVAIHNISEFKCLAEAFNAGQVYNDSADKAYYLAADITFPPGLENWVTIENFDGILIGDGKTIRGKINKSIFNRIYKATITGVNLDIERVYDYDNEEEHADYGRGCIGGLVRYSDRTEFNNITGSVKFNTNDSVKQIGGLAGSSEWSRYENIQLNVEIKDSDERFEDVGGIVGEGKGDGLLVVHVTGNIEGRGYVGGLVGKCRWNYYITSSSFSGTVFQFGDMECGGGLIGIVDGDSTVAFSYTEGTLNVDYCGGGIIGKLLDASMGYCYSSMSVINNGGGIIGGAIGYVEAARIDFSSSSGKVELNASDFDMDYAAGGFIGKALKGTQIHDSFFAGSVYTTGSIAGGFAGIIAEDAEIFRNASFGTVSGTSIMGGFAGEIKTTSNTTKSTALNHNMSLSCYEGSQANNGKGNFGGFAGIINGSYKNVEISECYSIPCFSNGYRPQAKGAFIYMISNEVGAADLNIENCYYYNPNNEMMGAVYQNNSGRQITGLKALHFDEDNLLDEANTPLVNILTSEDWAKLECTLPGMGSKKYRIPVCYTPDEKYVTAKLPKPPYCW